MKAYVTVTKQTTQIIELDVDDLVETYGKKAKGKKWLADYAVGNSGEGISIETNTEIEFDK